MFKIVSKNINHKTDTCSLSIRNLSSFFNCQITQENNRLLSKVFSIRIKTLNNI